jgi:hypothetical protein
MKKSSIIGKKYYPMDNSYCVNLTSTSNYPYKNDTNVYLAGARIGDEVKECIILSEPFKCIINTNTGLIEEKMVIVNYNNNTYSVLYYKEGIHIQ